MRDIWHYSVQRGLNAAEQYVGGLRSKIDRIAEMPGLGRLADPRHPGVRIRAHAYHRIYYRYNDETLTVLTIRHERMSEVETLP